ncbi:MAG: HDOD domain-containing protein [Candidatus Hydrogenedentes bacterium]|nr:HDOD domain-containing protein [Candidatus Hydrogenedentota bacterium]
MANHHVEWGELLVNQGLIAAEALKDISPGDYRSHAALLEELIAFGHADIRRAAQLLATLPEADVHGEATYDLSETLVNRVPAGLALKHHVFPIDDERGQLILAVDYLLDNAGLAELEEATGSRIQCVLWNSDDLYMAIHRYYREERQSAGRPLFTEPKDVYLATLRLGSIAPLIREIDELPSLPETVLRVQAALHNDEISVADIAAIVRRDPPIAAKLLKTVNSAAFGFRQRVDSVDHAVALLGIRGTWLVTASSAIIEHFESSPYFDYPLFWGYAHFCAETSSRIAQKRGERDGSLAYTAGLLHDIGRLVLAEVAPSRYSRIASALPSTGLLEAESSELGLTHTEAGYLLASQWNLPDDLLAPIRYHHHLSHAREYRELVATVQVSNVLYLAAEADPAQAPLLLEECAEALSLLGLSDEDALTIGRDVLAQPGS